jgi:hypothetical protein
VVHRGRDSSLYVLASAACQRATCDAKKKSDNKTLKAGRWAYDLEKVRRQKDRYAEMEARLIIMSQATENYMGNHKEEAAHHSTKKMTSATSFVSSSAGYLSPTRISSGSKKRNPVSSSATHYAIRNCHPPLQVTMMRPPSNSLLLVAMLRRL